MFVIQYVVVSLSILKILHEDFMRSYSLYFTKKLWSELGKMDVWDFSDPATLQGYKFMLVINCCKLLLRRKGFVLSSRVSATGLLRRSFNLCY